jgi:HEAT repeat protein
LESDGDGGWRPNEKAATELEWLAPDAAQLVPLMKDQRPEVRRGAAFFLLGRFHAGQPEEVAAFSALLDDSDGTLRGFGLSALKQMSEQDQAAAVPRLVAMLDRTREQRPENRMSVARLLGSLKSAAASAGDKLADVAAADPDPRVRSACLVAIVQVASAEQALPPLAQGLADADPAVRLVAAARLRQLGPAAAGSVRELAAALADSDARVREAAAEALIRIGKPAVEATAAALASADLNARKLALACLAKIGPDASAAAPAVEKCLADSDPEVKKLAAAALARIKP